jgi:hypothetical protein
MGCPKLLPGQEELGIGTAGKTIIVDELNGMFATILIQDKLEVARAYR